jgi:acyl-CoA dehydrogenase
MNFEFSPEQQQLRDHARRMLSIRSSSQAVRAVLDGPQLFDRPLWQELAELGYLGTAIPEAYGGAGASYLELCVIAEELGRSLAPVPFSSSIVLAADLILRVGSEAQKRWYLPKLASGELIATLAFVEGAGTLAPESIATVASRGKIHGTKVPVADGAAADVAIVLAREDGRDARGPSLYLVDLRQTQAHRHTVDTIDPTRKHARIEFSGAAAELCGPPGDARRILEDTFDRAAVLIGFEQIGGADRALEMARDYALDRMAFGRPIGSFQAIKHMLADMHVSATLARSNCYYGAWALSTGSQELPEAAAAARVSATHAYQHCSRNNIQVHGGMGFTWELDCHLHYRRSNLLALSIGSQSTWEDLLIRRLTHNAAPDAAFS